MSSRYYSYRLGQCPSEATPRARAGAVCRSLISMLADRKPLAGCAAETMPQVPPEILLSSPVSFNCYVTLDLYLSSGLVLIWIFC